MIARLACVVAALCCAALPALAGDDPPPRRGTFAPSGSTFTSTISAGGDVDAYVLQGFPGMKLTAVVRAAPPPTGNPLLAPAVEFVRPDGSVPDDDAGFVANHRGSSVTGTMTLDAVGWWQVRVHAADVGAPPATQALSWGDYAVGITYKAAPRPTLPVVTRSFTRAAEIAPKFDTDDVAFDAYVGQTIDVVVKRPRGGTLVPGLTLLRPDGSSIPGVASLDGGQTSVKTTVSASESGTWRARVFGIDPSMPPDPQAPKYTTGRYAIAVKLGRASSTPSLLPDVNGQYVFQIPAVGDAVVGWTLAFKGAAPTFNSFLDPTGAPVPDFVGSTKVPSLRLPAGLPMGSYTLTFDAPQNGGPPVTFASKVTLPRPAKRRVATLSTDEPIINVGGIDPVEGGRGVIVAVRGQGFVDPRAPNDAPGLFLNDVPLADVHMLDAVTIVGTIPDGVPTGVYDVVATSTTGQAVVAPAAFAVVPPPVLLAVAPSIGPTFGGAELTLTGRNFRAGVMALVVDGNLQPVTPTFVDATTLKVVSPGHGAGTSGMAVRDLVSRQDSNALSFTFVPLPVTIRTSPQLVPLLAGETVTLDGFSYAADDHVFLETTTKGVFEDLSAAQTTFVDSLHHRFVAPIRPKGDYALYVQDALGRPAAPNLVTLTVFSYSDATAAAGLDVAGDPWDAWTSALADVDHDGDADLIVSRRGAATLAATSETRVLRNDGHGAFTDVTASVVPAVVADDWRADRIAAADIDRDGFVDLVLTTNSKDVPAAGTSHTRILMNEARGGTEADAADRVLRDRTLTVMPAARPGKYSYPSGLAVADDWRGLDLWVGDLDTATSDRPSIVITHDETKQEVDVSCAPFCASPFAAAYTYGFYWGGSRAFFWDKNLNGGLGKYKFERNFFPRKSGLRVPIGAPGGVDLPICNSNYGQSCAGKFTPFTGQRVAVGDLNGDGKLDVAVVSNAVVQRIYPPATSFVTISSLQVGINKFNAVDGAELTDVTNVLTALGGDFTADAVAIGHTGLPDGDAYGTIAVAKATPIGSAGMLRLVKFKPAALPSVAAFDDVTTLALPAPDATDLFQASRMVFVDVDQDGDQDLALLAAAAPGGTRSAFRVLRNGSGVFTRTLDGVLPATSAGEHFEGDALAVGDVTGDGLLDYVVTRAVSSGSGTQTRIVKTDH